MSPSGLVRRLPDWLSGAWSGLAWAIVCGLMLAVLALAAPFAAGLFVDRVVGGGEPWGLVLAGALAGAALLVYGVTWLKQRFLWRLAIRVSIVAGNRSVSRLLRLPVDYFSHRLVGDLTARILSIDRVAQGLSERFLGLLVDVAMSVVFLVVMLAYDLPLALAVLDAGASERLLLRPVARARSDEASALRREQGLLMGIGTIMLNQADALRMTAAEDRMFARWSGHQARELQVRQRFSELNNLMAAAPDLFMILGSAAVLALGATKVMSGDLTLGALLALLPRGHHVPGTHRALRRVRPRAPDASDRHATPGRHHRNASGSRPGCAGRKHRSRSPPRRASPVGGACGAAWRDLRLQPEPSPADQRLQPRLQAGAARRGGGSERVGEVDAVPPRRGHPAPLVGGDPVRWPAPGRDSRRSAVTLPLDGGPARRPLLRHRARQPHAVESRAVLDDDVVAAARDAAIHDDILSRPRGYAAPVDEDGVNFSGGQRQRLEIARALVGNPTVLILDEATSALDAATEAHVDDALRRRGVSCLIVAHRLSTVRDCDQIIVIDKGVAVQRGTHDELMADTGGVYHRLVRTELAG